MRDILNYLLKNNYITVSELTGDGIPSGFSKISLATHTSSEAD